MASAVVDTDVVSYVFRGDTRAALYRPHLEGLLPVLSFMTIAELSRWAIERNWGAARRAQMRAFLGNFVVYPFDPDLCERWADVTVTARHLGRPIQHADAWIAATALLHNIPLITHNRDDYAGVPGLVVVSARAP